MASTTTTTRTIRIKNETEAYFKDKALNRAVDSLAELLKNGSLKFDGETIQIMGGRKEEKTDCDSILEMACLMRVDVDYLLKLIKDLLENGDLVYSNGKLVNPTYEELEAVCDEKKINKENLIYKVIRDIENGK